MFSPQGQQLITVADDCKIKVWSGNLGQLVSCIGEKEEDGVSAVAIAPNGHQVAAGFRMGHVKLFDIDTGQFQKCLILHMSI